MLIIDNYPMPGEEEAEPGELDPATMAMLGIQGM